ncbi:MAG: shikimate dehydrogenase [Omnitrophica bacterium]|nr:shikimate dehydrogenase [Candidatus Omnitrophota bacterium]
MKTYGLLGETIGYSLSHHMHNAAFSELGLEAEYKIFDIPESGLGDFFSRVKAGTISGCNVTIPYKERALAFIESLSPAVRAIGALNTIVREDGKVVGHNTDYHGFVKSLRGRASGDLGFEPEEKSAFVFGAGGAAKAVVYSLLILGAKKIAIADMDIKKAETLAASVVEKQKGNALITVVQDEAQYDEFISRSDLLVNATPCGISKGDAPLFDYKFIDKTLAVFDLIYAKDTPLVMEAKLRGAKVINGLNMLLYQAARSFELWTGNEAPLDAMRKALSDNITK